MTRLLFLFRVVQKGVDDRIKKLKVSKCQSTYQRGGSGDVRLCTKFGTFESEMEKGKDDLTCAYALGIKLPKATQIPHVENFASWILFVWEKMVGTPKLGTLNSASLLNLVSSVQMLICDPGTQTKTLVMK